MINKSLHMLRWEYDRLLVILTMSLDAFKRCRTDLVCFLLQQCIVLHTLDNNFNPTYKLGCADTNVSNLHPVHFMHILPKIRISYTNFRRIWFACDYTDWQFHLSTLLIENCTSLISERFWHIECYTWYNVGSDMPSLFWWSRNGFWKSKSRWGFGRPLLRQRLLQRYVTGMANITTMSVISIHNGWTLSLAHIYIYLQPSS